MKMKQFISLTLVGTLCAGLLAGCGASQGNEDKTAESKTDKVISIGASVTPHGEIVKALEKEFEKEGYELKLVEFTDYVQPNKALQDGQLDANFFQHKPFLDNFNKENETDLLATVAVNFLPMALFSGKTKTLDALQDGATIAVPNDVSNEARALLLLADNGLIKLKEGSGIGATKRDIIENPKNLDIVEMEAAQIPRSRQDVDLAVINGNYVQAAKIPFDENLAAEGKDALALKVYANIVAVRAKDKDSEKTKVINKVMTSDACKKFIDERFKGAVLSVGDLSVKEIDEVLGN